MDTTTHTGNCARCRASIDPSSAELDDHGRPVCRACVDKATLAEGSARSTAALSGAASTAALLALASVYVGYLAFPSVAVGSGALIAARTADRLAPGSVASWIYLAAGGAVIFAMLRVLAVCMLFT